MSMNMKRFNLRGIAALARSVLGFKVVWLSTVLGAANGADWLGLAALLAFAAVQLFFSRTRRCELGVLATGLAMGLVLETIVHRAGWIAYAPGWPQPLTAPAWILALWGSFSLMSIDGLAWLRGRRLLAAVLGAVGAPFAYFGGISLGAGSGASIEFYVSVALFYALATPLLVELAGVLKGGEAAPGGRKSPGATC